MNPEVYPIIENTLYARVELWEDPSCRSDFPNRIPSYNYVEYGGKYVFQTNETEEEIQFSLDQYYMYDAISYDCDIESGIRYHLDFKLEDGICTVWITDAEVDDDYGYDYGDDY
jgi:hypothetical protein